MQSKETHYSDENQSMEHEPTRNLPYLFDQKGSNDLIKDLNLSKNGAEILGSRLKKINLLCGDFKVIGILLGLQSGYTKYCCFLCTWDSRAR